MKPHKYLRRRWEQEVAKSKTTSSITAKMANGIRALHSIYKEIPSDEELEGLTMVAKEIVDIRADEQNKTPLTRTSKMIGEFICNEAEEDVHDHDDTDMNAREWHYNNRRTYRLHKRHIVLGDILLESLAQCHEEDEEPIITITRQSREAYMIEIIGIDHELDHTLRHTSFIPIQPITHRKQANGHPVIKRWGSDKDERFQSLLDKPFIQALDKMQAQSWRINTPVYEAILAAGLPEIDSDANELKQDQQTSKRRDRVGILKRAEQLLDRSFYQYVDCDYRGRVYYMEPYMNFQGSDYARGMMLFDKPKRVTKKGLVWLAQHTANCFNRSYTISELVSLGYHMYADHLKAEGLESISVDKFRPYDKEAWTWNNMGDILKTARSKELHDCEKPVSFLACCLEWEKYHDNPRSFTSALPIPIDGSNNGWQHLAAISKDPEAGRLVGLVPTDIQEDFYVKTAKALIERMPEWFEERSIPMKHIRKGISKRGSMTRAYSAGAIKIADNMYLDCRTEGYTELYNITEKDCIKLAQNLVEAIKDVCPGPLQTMAFLQKLAGTKVKGTNRTSISWIVPFTGFPVRYRAPRIKSYSIRNSIRGLGQVNHVAKFPERKPDIQKFMSGISPNFIHSLDASHMSVVAAGWYSSFGGVHDSFSTYADDVDELQRLTKAVFINMYTSDNNYKDILRILQVEEDITLPGLGSLDINEVNNAQYFFS